MIKRPESELGYPAYLRKIGEHQIAEYIEGLQTEVYASGPRVGQKVFTPLVALAFMLFVLLYVPCTATVITCRKEFGRKWAWVMSIYTFALAWLVSFAVFQIGSLF